MSPSATRPRRAPAWRALASLALLLLAAACNGAQQQAPHVDDQPLIAPKETAPMLALTLHKAGPDQPATRLVARLENVGSDDVLANTRLGITRPRRGGELHLAVTDASGAALPFAARVNVRAPRPSNFEVLHPGDHRERSFDLARYYTADKLTPGATFTVVATYANTAQPEGGGAWEGELTSAPVEVTVP